MAAPHRPTGPLSVSLVARAPAEAQQRADRLLAGPVDPRTRASALRVSGPASYELGPAEAEALRRLSAAVRGAVMADPAEEAASARSSLPDSTLALAARGVAACRSGRFDAAIDAFTRAEPTFRAASDPRLLPGLLCRRGLALLHAGRPGEAEDTLFQGLALAQQYSLPRLGAAITQHLGCLAAFRGDTALAMERFDAAAPLLEPPTRHPALALDRAHALADAGLLREAALLLRSLDRSHADGAHRASAELLSLKLAVARDNTAAATAVVHRLRRLFGPGSSWLRAAEQITETFAGVPRAARTAGGPPAPRPATPHLEVAAHADHLRTRQALHEVATALRAGNAAAALLHLERSRAVVTAPCTCRHRGWAALLDDYRAAHAAARRGAAEAGRRLARLEVELAVHQWHPCCRRPAPPPEDDSLLVRLSSGLGSRALVHYSDLGGTATAVSLVDGQIRMHELADSRTVADAVAAFEHLARMQATAPRGTTAPLLAQRAEQVHRLLVAPVAEVIGDRELVLVPGRHTQTLPWGLLPGLRGRPVSVAPSGRAWLRCRERARRFRSERPRVLVVAGPHLAAADAEAEAVARLHRGARRLTGDGARSRSVLRGLARADLAHLSAHGFAWNGAPMCTGLWLADGPLFAYDLERVRRLPVVVVLSSCDSGRSAPAVSGFPLGMAASLLARGSATVVASVLPVSDGETVAAMVRAHGALRSGVPPAAVVAEHLADAGFVCFGAG
ncbi:CHAT domain-containing protein [Thermobifida cellulosilytica]|uniref:CHAT domain-containing protein n=1 Tax=Thermobifida cellulosilytica TB100 TaxID=665004 RepID=A0A147KHK5_THECS|nr:CHAT domain-containing protein [Thermobifida cellulosilytica]KUP96777.1 hypothetical protein AC529_10650 [Thermobifida cellulosilytica TB100]